MNRYKRVQKLLNWLLSLVLIVTSISVPGVAVSAEDENADISNVAVVEDDESQVADYSDAIRYDLNYNEDYSKATLTITVDTADNVSLDFSNNDELSEKMGGESPSYSIDHEITTEDGKTYAFDIVKNGAYNFQAIVLAEGEDFDGQMVGSKDISIQVTDLVEGEEVESEYEAQETGTDATFTITQSNVQLAYYNWQAGNPPTSTKGVTLNTISAGTTTQTITNYVDSSNSSGGTGYVVFFVKPNDNYLFTGLNADGLGQCFAVNETFNASDYKNSSGAGIGGYPGLQYVIAAAYNAGYKAVFGWMRAYDSTDVNLSFTTTAVQPKMEISVAAPLDTSNVKPGDTLDFTVTVTPESESNSTIGKVTLTKINETDVSYECTDTGSGTYTYTVPYTITQADFEAGKVTLSASGTVKYNCSFGITSGKVNSEALIAETASADASPGPNFAKKATATHQFASSTSGKELPDEVTKLCPADKVIPVGVEYTPETLASEMVRVSDGYWTFEGWDSTPVTPTTEEASVTVTGKWKFVDTTLNVTAPKDVVYNGASQQQEPEVKDVSGNVLTKDVDYTLSYSEDTTNVGQVMVTVTGLKGYGSVSTSYQIKQRPITFVGKSASKTYNGKEQTVEGYTVSTAEGQYGLVEGHTATLTASASGTDFGTHEGTITDATKVEIKTTDGVDVTANYAITTKPGTLTITAKNITGQEISVDDLSDVTYNGIAQKQDPVVTDGTTTLEKDKDYTVSYKSSSTDGDDYTNAGNTITVTITGKGNYSGTVEKTYTITKAPLTVTTKSDSKVYDGDPLTAEGKLDGLVNGETATFTVTGNQTDVGSSENTYTIDWEHGTAKESNYTIQENKGTLTVEAQHLTPETDPENPSKEDSNYKGVTVKDPQNVVYDGDDHKFVPEVTTKDGTKLTPGTDYEVTYTKDGQTTDDFTNSGEIKITITGKGNYSGTVEKTYSITKRPITFVGNSKSKTYNGQKQTVEGYTVSKAEGQYELVEGHTASLTASASGTNVGTYEGNITAAANVKVETTDGVDVTANYAITTSPGTLKITEKSISGDTKDITVKDFSDVTYNGTAQKQDPVVTDGTTTLVKDQDYTVSYKSSSTDGDDYTNAGNTITVTITGKGNYSGTVEKTYTITKAPLTVTTKSDSKVYDGDPLTAEGKLDGLVNGETATFTVTGNQTDVGSSENTYTIDWEHGTAKESNYTIQENKGTLTVEAQHLTPETDPENPSKEDSNYKGVTVKDPQNVVYDGDDHKFVPEVTTKDGTKLTPGTDYEVTYTKDGQTTDDFTNSGEIKITITGKGNYSGTVEKTYSITKRPITFVGNSKSKTYNGQKQTVEGYTVSKAEGQYELVEGHTASLTASASGTNVGTYEGNITAAANVKVETTDGVDVTANYAITTSPGTLKITEKSISGDTKDITVKDFSDVTYNGTAQKQDPVVTDGTTTLVKDQDYTVSYKSSSTDGDDYTNAGNTITVTITGKRNYSGTIEKTYTIKKAPLTLKMNSATKVYDGNVLTAGGSLEGLVGDETVTLTVTGSQTNVGESDNTYNLDWNGTAKADNYTVTVEKGTLTVEAQHLTPEVDPEDSTKEDPNYNGVATNDPENVVYDGEEHKFVPEVTTKDGTKLTPGVDYDVIYSTDDFTNPGEIKVIIIGKGNYSGTIEKTYKIVEKEKSNPQPSDTKTKSDTKGNNSNDNKTTTVNNTTSQATNASVKTGDTSNLIFWISLLALAALVAVVTLSLRRRR